VGKKKILLVDTDIKFLNSLKEYLENSGIEVEIVMDGNTALEKAKDDFNAVITGVVIPKMDGLKLSERIYNLTMGKTPVIIVSGIYKGTAIRNKAIHNGKAVEFIEKPFSKEVIKKVLEEKAHFVFETVKKEVKEESPEDDDAFKTRTFEKEELTKESREQPPEVKEDEKVSSEILFGDILDELNEDSREEIKAEEVKEEITPIEEPAEEIIELDETNEVNEEQDKKIIDKVKKEEEKPSKIIGSSNDSDIDALISSITNYEKQKPKERRTNIDSDDIDELISKTLVDLKIKKKKINEVENLDPEKKKKQLEEIEKKIEEKQKSIEAEQKKVVQEKGKKDEITEKPKTVKPEIKAEGKYQLIEKIATGGMAEIYKAKQRGPVGFEKIVTIKKILPHLANDEEFIEMFIDEAKIAASLSHPNIVQIFDLGKMDNEFIIAMEYIAGIDLGTINKKLRKSKRHFPVEIPLYITLKVSEALDYAHKKKNQYGQPMGIVHRDVNPNNILVSFEGEVKLVDFGISKARVKLHHTVAGGLKGKYIYMSPEQASGKDVDLRTDIFALGILLYETLTLKNPFISFSEPAILEKVKRVDYEDPRKLNHSISEDIVKIIDKCMQKDPNKRYQNAKALRNDIEKVLIKEVNNIAILKDILSKFVAKNFPNETKKAGFTIDDTVELVKRKDEIDKIISEKTKHGKKEQEIKEEEEPIIELTEEDIEPEKEEVIVELEPVKEEKIIKQEKKTKPIKADKIGKKEKVQKSVKEERRGKTKTYEDILADQKKEKEKILLEKEIERTIGKEKHSFSTFMIIFLIIAVLGIGGYFAYQKYFSTSLPKVNNNKSVTPPTPEEMSEQNNNMEDTSIIGEQQDSSQNQNIDNTTTTQDMNTQTQQPQNIPINNNKNQNQHSNTIKQKPQKTSNINANQQNKKQNINVKQKPKQTIQKQTKPPAKIVQNNKINTQNNNSQNTDSINVNQNKTNNQGQISQNQTDNNKQETVKPPVIQNTTNNKPHVKKTSPKPRKIIQEPIIREGDLVAYPQLDNPVKVLKQVSPSLTYGETKLGAVRVIMQVLVNTRGKAEKFKILRIIPQIAGLDARMRKVIKYWKFSIPRKKGVKVKSWRIVSLLIKK
jgi:serine/threonine protein kinase/DNA-binding response OmpR family regulator